MLRKLRIPLLVIKEILDRDDLKFAIEVFKRNVMEMNAEIDALSAVRNLLNLLIERLQQNAKVHIRSELLSDAVIQQIAESLPHTARKLKEENAMADLEKAQEQLNKLQDQDVRIVYVPPLTVVSIHVQKGLGVSEDECASLMEEFVTKNDLIHRKPDLRSFGFNHPDGTPTNGPDHGYEICVSIPDDLEVPPPYEKKQMVGGMYAAHMIPMGAFEEWQWLFEWLGQSETYAFDEARNDTERMNGMLEENLNYISHFMPGLEKQPVQLDLLLPVRLKKAEPK